jgi:hypothetical protein
MFKTQKTVLPAGDFLRANCKISFLKKKGWPFRPSQFSHGSQVDLFWLTGKVKYSMTPNKSFAEITPNCNAGTSKLFPLLDLKLPGYLESLNSGHLSGPTKVRANRDDRYLGLAAGR